MTGGFSDCACICLLIACICIGSVLNFAAEDVAAGACFGFVVTLLEVGRPSLTAAGASGPAPTPLTITISADDCWFFASSRVVEVEAVDARVGMETRPNEA